MEVLSSAVSKLKTQRSREKKRVYWREKSLKNKITRIVRNETDALQWLIYHESAHYERQQEETGTQSTRDMIVRYVKHLTQITTAMSSFYVSVGVQRLLYFYSTSEAQRAYEWLTEHYANDAVYRTIKGTLMKELENRFGNSIQICKIHRGEQRFDGLDDQQRWTVLVERCLKLFTPWSTLGKCFSSATSGLSSGVTLAARYYPNVSEDALEIRRCHAFIDPVCYEELARKTGLDSPSQRLALPRFLNVNMKGPDDSGELNEERVNLTDDRVRRIMDRTAKDALIRQQALPKFLRILADGKECARLDVAGVESIQREIREGVKLLEILTEYNGKDVLLATHWIEYTRWEGVAPAQAVVDLGKERELLIQIELVAETEETPRRISLRLKCRSVSRLADFWEVLKLPSVAWYRLPGYGLAVAALIVLGWVGGAVRQRMMIKDMGKELAAERTARASAEERIRSVGHSITYQLTADEFSQRGEHGRQEATIAIPSYPSVVTLALPVGNSLTYRAVLRPFLENREVLSESLLTPKQSNETLAVQFTLPSVFVEDGQLYAIDLYVLSPSGEQSRLHSFTFRVIKE